MAKWRAYRRRLRRNHNVNERVQVCYCRCNFLVCQEVKGLPGGWSSWLGFWPSHSLLWRTNMENNRCELGPIDPDFSISLSSRYSIINMELLTTTWNISTWRASIGGNELLKVNDIRITDNLMFQSRVITFSRNPASVSIKLISCSTYTNL